MKEIAKAFNPGECIIFVSVCTSILVSGIVFFKIIFPNGVLAPDLIQINRMKKKLYEVEKLVLFKQGNANEEFEMNITKFRKLIPYAEYRGIIITKGKSVEGKAVLKSGKQVKIVANRRSPVLFFDVRAGNHTAFVFKDKVKDKWLELLTYTLREE